MQKKGNVIVEGEDLNVLIGSKPFKRRRKKKQSRKTVVTVIR